MSGAFVCMAALKRIIILAAILSAPCALAQEDGDLSRPMRAAIRLYERGEDLQAMDRFMEILTKGDPTERARANEYLNAITHRMNTGQSAPVRGSSDQESADIKPVARRADPPDSVDEPAPPLRKTAPAAPRETEMSAADTTLMRKEIRARMRSAQEKSLDDLRAVEGVRVVLRANGDPDAIGLPSPLLFKSGIAFQRGASRLLDPLTRLVFSLGGSQVLILPEGTSIGDAKVLDMRRTMGISSHLYQAGVAPPRVRVNLLNTQVSVPPSLQDFRGVIVVFLHDQPLSLAVENAIGDDSGPPISLGVYPQQIRPVRDQGAVIEFSVADPHAGVASWKFQLLHPSVDGSDLSTLQEVIGGGPVFHQIFWNGKRNYFGNPLPAGRYECVLSAVDAKNRRRTLHRWIQVLGEGPAPAEKLLSEAPAAKSAPPSPDLPGDSSRPLVSGVKPAAAPKRKIVKRPVRPKTQSLPSPEPTPRGADPTRYALAFEKNTHQMTRSSEQALAKAALALANYPLETLRVVGHSALGEPEGDALAGRRAKMVAGLLVNRYQVEPKKIQISSSASGKGAKVELLMGRGD